MSATNQIILLTTVSESESLFDHTPWDFQNIVAVRNFPKVYIPPDIPPNRPKARLSGGADGHQRSDWLGATCALRTESTGDGVELSCKSIRVGSSKYFEGAAATGSICESLVDEPCETRRVDASTDDGDIARGESLLQKISRIRGTRYEGPRTGIHQADTEGECMCSLDGDITWRLRGSGRLIADHREDVFRVLMRKEVICEEVSEEDLKRKLST